MVRPMILCSTSGVTTQVLDESEKPMLGCVLFADLDDCTVEDAVSRINEARKRLFFGDAYILRSSKKSLHVVVPEFHEPIDFLRFAVEMRSGHSLDFFNSNGFATLRYSSKNGFVPEFVMVVPSDFSGFVLSWPHVSWLCRMGAGFGLYTSEQLNTAKGAGLVVRDYFYVREAGD